MIKLLRSMCLKQQAVKPLEPKRLRGLRYLNVSILRGKKDYKMAEDKARCQIIEAGECLKLWIKSGIINCSRRLNLSNLVQ
jgi:hypothetical protein